MQIKGGAGGAPLLLFPAKFILSNVNSRRRRRYRKIYNRSPHLLFLNFWIRSCVCIGERFRNRFRGASRDFEKEGAPYCKYFGVLSEAATFTLKKSKLAQNKGARVPGASPLIHLCTFSVGDAGLKREGAVTGNIFKLKSFGLIFKFKKVQDKN